MRKTSDCEREMKVDDDDVVYLIVVEVMMTKKVGMKVTKMKWKEDSKVDGL